MNVNEVNFDISQNSCLFVKIFADETGGNIAARQQHGE